MGASIAALAIVIASVTEPAILTESRDIYHKQMVAAEVARDKAIEVARENFAKDLKILQHKFTTEGKLDAAIAVREELTKLSGQRKPERIGIAGHARGDEFEHVAPNGVLVGFDVSASTYKGDTVIGAIQPVYATESGYVRGPVFGKQKGRMVPVVAKRGYAVVHMLVGLHDRVPGFHLYFGKLNGKQFDFSDTYTSDWVGSEKRNAFSIIGGSRPVIGVFGRADDDLEAIGLLLTPR